MKHSIRTDIRMQNPYDTDLPASDIEGLTVTRAARENDEMVNELMAAGVSLGDRSRLRVFSVEGEHASSSFYNHPGSLSSMIVNRFNVGYSYADSGLRTWMGNTGEHDANVDHSLRDQRQRHRLAEDEDKVEEGGAVNPSSAL